MFQHLCNIYSLFLADFDTVALSLLYVLIYSME